MNKVILMGRLTREPDVRYSQNADGSMAVARYTLAVDRRRARNNNDEQSADFISCVAFGRSGEFAEKYLHQGTKIVVTGRLCSHRRSHRRRRLWLPGRRCPEPRCTIIIEGPGLRNKGGICRKTTAEVGTVAQRRAALQRSCKICGAGLTNGSGRGKVMGGKGQSAFLRQKNEVVVMEPAGSSGSLYPRSKNQTAAFLHAGERPGCA